MKRWMSVLTALALLVSALCVPALAADYVSASTPLGLSGARISNIRLAADAVNGTAVPYGGSFSFNGVVGARTSQRGYQSAENGRGVSVVGGGVAQVASAIWLAVKDLSDVVIVEKSTYGSRYNQNYVDSSADAILTDYGAGTDFSFRYMGTGSITIETYVSGDALVCRVSGASSGWDTGASGWESADSWDNGWNTGWNNASEVPTFE